MGFKRNYFFLIDVCLFLIIWGLFGFNTMNPDYQNYNDIYNYITSYGNYKGGVERGFEFAAQVANSLGLSYQVFLMFFSLIGFLLIMSTIRKYTNNITVVLLLYIIYPFFLDVVQIRNFMSMSIFVFAVRYLVMSGKLNIVKYITCILIASTFHNTALFYLLFILVKVKSIKKVMLITITSIVVGILIQSFIPSLAVKYLNSERYLSYFSNSTSIYAKILFIAYFIVNLLLIYYIFNKINKKDVHKSMLLNSEKWREKVEFANVLLKMNILVCISYVFIFIDVDFVRLYRNIFILNYILFSMIKLRDIFSYKLEDIFHNVCMTFYIVCSSLAFIFFQTYETVIYTVLTENLIIDLFR